MGFIQVDNGVYVHTDDFSQEDYHYYCVACDNIEKYRKILCNEQLCAKYMLLGVDVRGELRLANKEKHRIISKYYK